MPAPNIRSGDVLHMHITALHNGGRVPRTYYDRPLAEYPSSDPNAPELTGEFYQALKNPKGSEQAMAVRRLAILAIQHSAPTEHISHSFKVAQGLTLQGSLRDEL